MPQVEVNFLLPQVYEDVGVFKKKISKGPLRSRPPSAQGNNKSGNFSIVIEDIDMNFNPKPGIEMTDRTISNFSEKDNQQTRLGTNETVDLTAISQSLQNSLANLLQNKPVSSNKEDIIKQLGRKLSFKKKKAADAIASYEPSIDSLSNKLSSQNSEKKPRLKPLKPLGLPNVPARSKVGEDVFLKSIFGSKNKKSTDSTQSPEQSIDKASDGTESESKKGASGARMRFVRNILVPVEAVH